MLPSDSKCKPPLSGDGFARHYAYVTRAAAFRQADLTRALKAMASAGLTVAKVEIAPDGTIAVFTGDHAATGAQPTRPNPLDRFLPDWRDKAPLYNPDLAKPKRKRGRYGTQDD